MARPIIAALGFRAHTGWAAVVAVMPQWEVVERRRISYEPEATRFIYHRAADVACNEAEALIGTARTQASDKVRRLTMPRDRPHMAGRPDRRNASCKSVVR